VAVRLIIEDLEGATTVVNLGTEDVTIGRKPHNTIQLTEQNVSRSHAKLVFRDETWMIQDLDSYNGVKVNGVPIASPTTLRESDLIQIGDYHLTLTDDIDRATVDIERPRPAANDGYGVGGAMVSSSDLPSLSVDDLEPKRMPVPLAQPAPHLEENRSKVGLILGILGIMGALAVVLGIGWMMSQGDSSGMEETADKNKQATKQPEPPQSTTAGPEKASTGAEPVPEVEPQPEPADTGAVATTAPEPPPADTGEVEVETGEEPEAQPEEPKPKVVKPKLPPEEALAAARKASLQGNNTKAYSLAKDAYDQNQSGDALNLMGVAACKMGSESKAKAAHRKMTASDKEKLQKLCSSLGVEL
jgi:pSer/pThr/pTyr-binding forkhead associated (FHA) protein